MWVSLVQTSEGLNRTKGWARADSLSAWKSSSCDIVFYHLWTQTQTGTYTTGSPCSRSFGLKIMGLLSLHSYVSQFLKTNTMHQMNISCGFCFSGEPWLMLVMPFPVHVWCLSSVAQSCPTLCDPIDCSPPGSSVHRIFQARNTGMGCHFLLQGIFLTQGPKLRLRLLYLLHWLADSLAPRHLGIRSPCLGCKKRWES